MQLTKILGGGTSWYYLFDLNQRIIGTSHEDDKSGMNRLVGLLHYYSQGC